MTNTLKPKTVSGSTPPQPTTVFFNGRGGTGKTMLARLHAEWALQNHVECRILDLDRTNATLSAFFPDHTDRPPTADDNDVMNYLRDAINEQTTKHHHLIIDFGGGDLILKSLASRIRLVPFFRQYNIRPVMFHHFGADPDYLSFIQYFEKNELFSPDATVLILNEHVKPKRLSVTSSFEQTIMSHEVYKKTKARGAKLVAMPDLPCAHQIDCHRLMFYEAYEGRDSVKPDKPPALSPLDRAELGMWLEDMKMQFAKLSCWLPWLPAKQGNGS